MLRVDSLFGFWCFAIILAHAQYTTTAAYFWEDQLKQNVVLHLHKRPHVYVPLFVAYFKIQFPILFCILVVPYHLYTFFLFASCLLRIFFVFATLRRRQKSNKAGRRYEAGITMVAGMSF